MRYFLLFFLILGIHNAQVSGLDGWDIFIDPGHSQNENMGISGYSEAKEVLQVGLELMDILNTQSDIDTVYISRTDDNQSVSLYQRTNYANTVGASWYHSIHSDASSNPSTNRTLLLWGQRNNGEPDPPVGGEEMSSFMIDILTQGMRMETTGSWGDCSFYTWSDYCANSGGPYLYVNRNTNMPSELSEQGHHSNPAQNQLVMNAEYKRMLAYLFFWSILDYHDIPRPQIGKLAGIISDIESSKKINGATAQINSASYTTDSYESLFYEYSNDEEELNNGFFWFEGLADSSYEVIVSAENYYNDTSEVSILNDFITFYDVELLSSSPPIIVSSEPELGDSLFPAWQPIIISFSRKMDTTSIADAIEIFPNESISISWQDEKNMIIAHDTLSFETDYLITIGDQLKDVHGHHFDGDNDGNQGGTYNLFFRTGQADMEPPVISSVYPANLDQNTELFPIVNLQFNESLDISQSFQDYFELEHFPSNSAVNGELIHYNVENRSSICFFPINELSENTVYVIRLFSGLADNSGNLIGVNQSFSFQTTNSIVDVNSIDNFENNLNQNWWDPQLSGSSFGFLPGHTWMIPNTEVTNQLYGSNVSMEISYGWNLSSNENLIRTYLSGGEPRNIIFDNSFILQAYVFGDGSGNKIRFCVDDNIDVNAQSSHEVSPWYIIDWIGWKLISWNMEIDGVGNWIGDGQLDGSLRFDSFQMTHEGGQAQFGKIYIDDLRLLISTSLRTLDNNISDVLKIGKSYPNPFNAETIIPLILTDDQKIKVVIADILGNKITELVNGDFKAGNHYIKWNGTNNLGNPVSSGVYVYSVISGKIITSNRMVLVK
tara:strand:- start:1666 stop:4164 length:2499 start_codon:yes stop_codon:yes gene_type:complete